MSPRPLPEIAQIARRADCPHCGAGPLEKCWPGIHVARFIRAWRHGTVSDADLMAVLEAVTVFTWAAAVTDALLEAA